MENKHSTVSYVTAYLTTFLGGITLDQVAVWVGILTAVGTFGINWYYKYKDDKRQEARDGQPE